MLHHGGATVIVDYGHNPSALLALVEAIAQFPHERRSIVFSAAGDRRDEDIVRQGEILGDLFDHVVLYEDACNRGRADGEVDRPAPPGARRGPRVSETFETRGELKAVEHALRGLKPGDLLVIQADQVEHDPRLRPELPGEPAHLVRARARRRSAAKPSRSSSPTEPTADSTVDHRHKARAGDCDRRPACSSCPYVTPRRRSAVVADRLDGAFLQRGEAGGLLGGVAGC